MKKLNRSVGRFLCLICMLLATTRTLMAAVRAVPAPPEETLSKKFSVTADGQNVPVYVASVVPADQKAFIKAMDAKMEAALICDQAAFAYFDLKGSTRITVTCPEKIETAKLLPTSRKLTSAIKGNTVSFELAGPENITLEINGKEVECLHLFANPWEENPPKEGDPNVIYFGPGIHEIDNLKVSSGQTVYIAPGAVVRGKPAPGSKGGTVFLLSGSNIIFRGRGIVDGSLCPVHSRSLLFIEGKDILAEGVILRDSSVWTVPIRHSERVKVKNLKLIGYRANSDGIDICNSHDVTASNCFIRSWDDLVVVKTDRSQGTAGRILVEKCVLWNELAHALSVGAELREDVDDVRFVDCDVIHDKGREWTLRVFHCDGAHMRNIRFENIRVEESKRLISLWINKASWSLDTERGHIEGVSFKNIEVLNGAAQIKLQGFDETHRIENVSFDKVVINGKALRPDQVEQNAFTQNITVTP